MYALMQDLRLGLRLSSRTPGLTAAVVATLALAIGFNTAIFSVVNGVLLRPLPYPGPERLVQIWELNRAESDRPTTISPFNFLDWEQQSDSFSRMAVYRYSSFTLLGEQGPSRMVGTRVSGDFFAVLDVSPLLGRLPSREDDKPGSHVVVLSHQAWQERFGANPELIGGQLTIDNEPHTVIGVMPPAFDFPDRSTELWTLPAFELEGLNRTHHFLYGVGRLKPVVPLASAQSEADVIADSLARRYPSSNDGSEILLVPLHEQRVGSLRRELLTLWGAVTLILLLACGNVANLLLARAVTRQKEMSMRFAAGASRARVIRQLLTESLLLAVAGGGVGLILAVGGIHFLTSQPGFGVFRAGHVDLDLRVLGFSAAVTLLTGLGFGLVPAVHASKSELYPLLKQDRSQAPRGTVRRRLPWVLVAFQVGVASVLLVTTGLLLKSLFLLRQVPVGFEPRGLVTMQLSLPPALYPEPVARSMLFQQAVERIGEVPGVEGAAGINDLPFSGSRTRITFDVEGGLPSESASEVRNADYRTVVGDYFRTMGLEVLRGQTFDSTVQRQGPAVAVVNEELARRYFRGADPVGRVLMFQGSAPMIIGVVESPKHDSLAAPDAPEIYVPAAQGRPPEWIYFAIRSRLDLETLMPAVRSAAREVIPDHPFYNVQTMATRLARSTARQRYYSSMFSIFAGVALTLSLIGIYALIAYAARERTGEIAVRMVLGARRGEVIRLVVLRGVAPAAVGIVLGLATALAATRLVRAMLFGIGPADPWVYAVVPAVMAAGAVLASYLPARRATAIEPVTALRS